MNHDNANEAPYFTRVRKDLRHLPPPGNGLRVLEVGAGGGDTLIAMKQTGQVAEAVGVELFGLPSSNQQHLVVAEKTAS